MDHVDDSELRAFSADLTAAATKVALGAPAVVNNGARKIKDQMIVEMAASNSFKGATEAISYDLDAAGLSAEIGPVRGKPGSLANIAYFGTSRGGGTVPDPQGALEAEIPAFEKALADLAEGAL